MAYFRNLTHPHVRSYQFGMGLSGRKTGQKTGRKTCADRVEVPNKCSKLYHEGNTLGKIVHQLVIRPQQQPWTNKQSPTITTSISNGKQASTAINNNEQPWFILRQRWSFPNFVNTTDYPMTHLSLGFFKYKDYLCLSAWYLVASCFTVREPQVTVAIIFTLIIFILPYITIYY